MEQLEQGRIYASKYLILMKRKTRNIKLRVFGV